MADEKKTEYKVSKGEEVEGKAQHRRIAHHQRGTLRSDVHPRGILELDQYATHPNRAARVAHQAAGLCPSFSSGASIERPLYENSSRIRNREWKEP